MPSLREYALGEWSPGNGGLLKCGNKVLVYTDYGECELPADFLKVSEDKQRRMIVRAVIDRMNSYWND